MALSTMELRYQREMTNAFIAANPTVLELIPRIRVTDGRGTRWADDAPRFAQQLRIIDQSSSRTPQPGLIQASDGKERLAEFMLLGRHDAVMALWDHWTDAAGQAWELAQIFPWNQYEVRAQVIRRG